jgi:hypothetical protein
MSLNEQTARYGIFESRLADISSSVKLAPVVAPDELSELAIAIIDTISFDALDPVFLCLNGHLLVSEDMPYRALASEAFNVGGAWLQPILAVAAEIGHLSVDEHSRLCEELSFYKHSFHAVDAVTLLYSIEKSEPETFMRFEAHAEAIGGQNAEIISHYKVVLNWLQLAWSRKNVPIEHLRKGTTCLLANLFRGHEGFREVILAKMLYILKGDARRALAEWINEQQIPKSLILEEVEAIRRVELEQKVIRSVQAQMEGAYIAYQMALRL